MKLLLFHAVMVPWFVSHRVFECLRYWALTFLLSSTYLLSDYCTSSVIYWAAILFSVVGHMTIDVTWIFLKALDGETAGENGRRKLKLRDKRGNCSHIGRVTALPEYMVLGLVRLKQEFVGWLAKLGLNFLGYMDSMHKIG